MGRSKGGGLSIQSLTASLAAQITRLKTVKLGPMINVGIDNGTEFSFLVISNNGAEYVVTINETKPNPDSFAALEFAHKQRLERVRDKVAARDAKFEEQRLANLEAKRKRFLDA